VVTLKDGTFSAATLLSVPTSFQTTQLWEAALHTSMRTHGSTWLHYYHLGIISAEHVGFC
jgi:hypothetical protein